MANVTNYHILGNLKQGKFIYSYYWKPEVWNQGVSRAILPLEVLGENPLFYLPDSGGYWHSLARGCIAPTSASSYTSPHLCVILCQNSLFLSLIRTHVIAYRAHPDIFCHIRSYSQVPRVESGYVLSFWEPPFIPLRVICTKIRKAKIPTSIALAWQIGKGRSVIIALCCIDMIFKTPFVFSLS